MDHIHTWTGMRVNALRAAYRDSIPAFAARLDVSPRTVSSWQAEKGRPIRAGAANLKALDAILYQAPPSTREHFVTLCRQLQTNPPVQTQEPQNGEPNRHLAAMQGFRAADVQVGGGHMYATVLAYLRREVGPELFGGTPANESDPFASASGITEMAGWMAHDAGHNDIAHEHFQRSLDLARVGSDRQLHAHVLGSLAHLHHHIGRPADAAAYAAEGQHVMIGAAPNAGLTARLLAMEARAAAAQADTASVGQLLHRSEKALDVEDLNAPSPWISGFDEGSLASEAVRCLRAVGNLPAARRSAESIVILRRDRARSLAFGQLALAGILVDQGFVAEGCETVRAVLGVTHSVASALVLEQLAEIRTRLKSGPLPTEAAETVEGLDRVLRGGASAYRWVVETADGGNRRGQ